MQKPLTEKQSVAIHAAMGHPLRLRILHALLTHEELTVTEIMTRVGADKQPNVSAALIKLKSAGLVESRYQGNAGERGNTVRYTLHPDLKPLIKKYLDPTDFTSQKQPPV